MSARFLRLHTPIAAALLMAQHAFAAQPMVLEQQVITANPLKSEALASPCNALCAAVHKTLQRVPDGAGGGLIAKISAPPWSASIAWSRSAAASTRQPKLRPATPCWRMKRSSM